MKIKALSSGFTTKQAERQAHVPMSLYEACAGSKTVRGFTTKRVREKRNSDFSFANERREQTPSSGFTLVEIIIAVGLFTVIMTLASGAYLIMIGANRQAQSVATGINNLSFALETMTRTIRTGTNYGCPTEGIDCGNGGPSFSFRNENNALVTYDLSASTIRETKGGVSRMLTDSSVNISSLVFYASGTAGRPLGDYRQPRVTIVVSGTVSSGPGRPPESFTIETGATMRGSDI